MAHWTVYLSSVTKAIMGNDGFTELWAEAIGWIIADEVRCLVKQSLSFQSSFEIRHVMF